MNWLKELSHGDHALEGYIGNQTPPFSLLSTSEVGSYPSPHVPHYDDLPPHRPRVRGISEHGLKPQNHQSEMS